MNNRGFAPILALLILLAGSIFIASATGLVNIKGSVASITGSSDYIQAPYFATISCVQSGTSKSFSDGISKEGEWISDSLPKNTNEWSVMLEENIGSKEFNGRIFFQYYVCPQKTISSNCKRYDGISNTDPTFLNIGTISSDQHIWVQREGTYLFTERHDTNDKATFTVTYKPFSLYRQDSFRGGYQPVSGALACQVPYSDVAWSDRVLDAVGVDVDIATTRDLIPGESFNYISGTVTRLSEGNVQDGGYCIYSNGKGQIYPISKVTTASGNYNIVDVTDSPIKSVQCCTGDNLPDKTCVNGQWKSTIQAECSLFNPCEGTEWRASLQNLDQAVKYQCVQSQCKLEEKNVECTVDSQCSTNEKCDQNSFTCEQASVVGGPGEERIPLNQVDCVAKGYKWIPEKTTKKDKFLGLFGGESVTVEAHCEVPGPFNWKLWLGLGFVVIILFAFRSKLLIFVKKILPF